MPKNSEIINHKPKNEIVFDAKPKNEVSDQFTDKLYEQVLSEGMYMGIPPHIYSETGTVLVPTSY